MTNVEDTSILRLPYYQYVLSNGQPAFNAQIYVGIANTDPVNPANQIDVLELGQGGTLSVVEQPIRTNAAGQAVNEDGDVIYPVVSTDYSITVQDANGALIYEESFVRTGQTSIVARKESLPITTDNQTVFPLPANVNSVTAVLVSNVILLETGGAYTVDINAMTLTLAEGVKQTETVEIWVGTVAAPLQDIDEAVIIKDSVAAMVADLDLSLGDSVDTVSYYADWAAITDKPYGGARYTIVDPSTYNGTPNNLTDHILSNGLYAVLVDGDNAFKHGARGDGTTNDSPSIQSYVDSFPIGGQVNLLTPPVYYAIRRPIVIDKDAMVIEGSGRFNCQLRKIDNTATNHISTSTNYPYTFNTPCIFELRHGDEADALLRHFDIRGVRLIGTDDTVQVAFDAPRCAYVTCENMESQIFFRSWQSALVSFIIKFENWRSSDCRDTHWEVNNGNIWTWNNCYANGSPSSGVGIRVTDANNVLIQNTPADTLAVGFDFYGNANASIVGSGTETRRFHVRSDEQAKVNIFGGDWAMTLISSQDDDSAAIFWARGESEITAYSPVMRMYNFGTDPNFDIKRAALSSGSNSRVTVIDPILDEISESFHVAFTLDSFTAFNTGSYIRVEKYGVTQKTINNERFNQFTTSTIQKKPNVVMGSLTTTDDETPTQILFNPTSLTYGQGLYGQLVVRAVGVTGDKSLFGESRYQLTIESRNDESVTINTIYEGIRGFDDSAVGYTISGTISSGDFSVILTPDAIQMGQVLLEVYFEYFSGISSGESEYIEVSIGSSA